MDVGNTLEEAITFLQYHQELVARLQSKKDQITDSVILKDNSGGINQLWIECEKQMDLRERLLEQSVKFHRAAKMVGIFHEIQAYYLFIK